MMLPDYWLTRPSVNVDEKTQRAFDDWKIEQFHRETKQLTGLEGCQCRKARIVRNHIGCAILVWVRLKQVAHETGRTIYQVKHGLLADYLRQQLRSPTIKMTFA